MKKETNNYLIGLGVVMVANVAVVGSNYIVQILKISPADFLFLKGAFQIPLMALLILFAKWRINNAKSQTTDNDSPPANDNQEDKVAFLPTNISEKVALIALGVTTSAIFATQFSALLFIPMADFIVITSTSSIYAYFLQQAIQRSRISLLKTFFCLMVIAGVVLVVQPWKIDIQDPISVNATVANETYSANSEEALEDGTTTKFTTMYWIGFGLAIAFALSTASTLNILFYVKDLPINVMMFWTAWGNVAISFVLPFMVGVKMDILYSVSTITLIEWLANSGLVLISVLISYMFVWGTLLCSPSVMSMMRRLDILLVMLVDMIFFNIFPDVLETFGYIIVFASVCLMVVADNIQKWIESRFFPVKEETNPKYLPPA